MTLNTLQQQLGDLQAYDYYLIGTSSFMKGMNDLMAAARVPAEQIVVEHFG